MGPLPQLHDWRTKQQEGPHWHQGRQHQQWMQYSAHPASSQPQPQMTRSWAHQSPLQSSQGCSQPQWQVGSRGLGSTLDHDRDSVVEVSGDDADWSGDHSDLSSDPQESAADCGPKSATGDFLMCSDTEEAAINSTHKKFQKKSSGLL